MNQVERALGVPAPTIRSWERRYSLVEPLRTDGGQRLYSGDDVAVLARMRDLIAEGCPAVIAAARAGELGLPSADLSGYPRGPRRTDDLKASLVTAAFELDIPRMQRALDQAFSAGSFEHVWDDWLVPCVEELALANDEGRTPPPLCAILSMMLLRRLGSMYEALGDHGQGCRVIVALPRSNPHEIGAYAHAVAMRRRGLKVLYLGSVDTHTLVGACRDWHADAVVLGVRNETDQQEAARSLNTLTEAGRIRVFSGGPPEGPRLADGIPRLPCAVGESALEIARRLTTHL